MIKTKFKIQGMHCVGCAMTIDGALEDLPGVKLAKTNYSRQVVEIEYDEKQIPNTGFLIQAIVEAGYQATVSETGK